jgi:NAD(P)H-flavin reductase
MSILRKRGLVVELEYFVSTSLSWSNLDISSWLGENNIEMLPGGVGTEFVKNLHVGQDVIMRGPFGNFVFEKFDRNPEEVKVEVFE